MEDCVKDASAVQYVRCLKCNKIIKCSRHDTTQLIDHIKSDHPEVVVVENAATVGPSLAGGGGSGSARGGKRGSADVGAGGGGAGAKGGGGAGGAGGGANGVAGDEAQQPKKSQNKNPANNQNSNLNNSDSRSIRGHLFRTSIERWRPASGTIYCPFCGSKKQPLVKMRNERLSGNSYTANCMLSCWPLCFLPFLLPGTEREYLYCANCKSFLGLYDKANNCIRPNKQFSEKLKSSGEGAKRP